MNGGTILVTGHDGYIGSVLVPHLRKLGWHVVGLDTSYFEDCQFTPCHTAIPTLRKDVRDITEADLAGVTAVIHLAALSNDPVGALSPALTEAINYHGSVRLARAAKVAGVRRFLFASSCSLYGRGASDWMDESSPVDPLTAYAKSKVQTEMALRALADERFCPVILRFATVYGMAPKLRVDLVVNNLVGWGIVAGEIRLQSDGTPWRPLIHVQDVARAYAFFLEAPSAEVSGGIVNVGFESLNFRVRDIAGAVCDLLPGVSARVAASPDRDSRSYRVRFSRFQSLTGWTPAVDLARGVRELADAYRSGMLTEDVFLGRKFIRLNQLRYLLTTGELDVELRWRMPR